MFFFLLKKSFFDAWDHLGMLIAGNLAILLTASAGLWPMFKLLESENPAGFVFPVIALPLLFIVTGTVSSLASSAADYKRVPWSDIPAVFRKTWKASLLASVAAGGFFAVSSFGMTYYSSLKTMLGLGASALLFWISAGVYCILIWFFPVRNRLTGNFKKSVKKSALIMFDNMLLTLFLGFIFIPLQMLLWPLTAFGAFGPAGIQLSMNGALRLLMFKYDWLEEHPDANRRDVPWFELLIDEKERVGKRTLKGMIFPWKE